MVQMKKNIEKAFAIIDIFGKNKKREENNFISIVFIIKTINLYVCEYKKGKII